MPLRCLVVFFSFLVRCLLLVCTVLFQQERYKLFTGDGPVRAMVLNSFQCPVILLICAILRQGPLHMRLQQVREGKTVVLVHILSIISPFSYLSMFFSVRLGDSSTWLHYCWLGRVTYIKSNKQTNRRRFIFFFFGNSDRQCIWPKNVFSGQKYTPVQICTGVQMIGTTFKARANLLLNLLRVYFDYCDRHWPNSTKLCICCITWKPVWNRNQKPKLVCLEQTGPMKLGVWLAFLDS